RNAIGVSECTRTPIPGLMHCVDAQRDAMRELSVSAVGIECEQRVPKLTGLRWQLIGPTAMPVVDGVVETGRLAAEDHALHVHLNAGLGRVVIEELKAEGMKRCQECHVRILSKRIAQGERAIRRELGQQPVEDWLQAAVFVWFLSVRWDAGHRLNAFDRSRI